MPAVTFADIITFTRASSATRVNASGVIETVSTNVARFDYDPATLEAKGLLIEEQRTNYLLQSSTLASSAWGDASAGTTTITQAFGIAPDGTNTLVRLQGNNVSTWWFSYYRASGTTASQSYTFSIWLKANAGTPSVDLLMAFNGGNVYSKTVALTSVLTRYEFTQLFVAGDTQLVAVAINHGNGNDISGWGAQLEAGAFATSYIPTVASQVTRSADVASITGSDFSDWFNASEGTFVVEGDAASPASSPLAIDVNDGSANNRIRMFASTTSHLLVTSATASQCDIDGGTVSASTVFKIAAAYKVDDFAAVVDGVTPATDTSGAVAVAPNQVALGANRNSAANFLNGHIRSIRYYPERLSDEKLQELTA